MRSLCWGDATLDEQAREQFLEQVRAAAKPPPKSTNPADVSIGQVRKLRAYDDDRDSMLVLVVGVDEIHATATVVVVRSPADQATKRDLVLSREVTGFPFDTVVMVDVIAKVWTTQLDRTRTVGTLSALITDVAWHGHQLSSEEFASKAVEVGGEVGELDPHVGDHMWWLRGQTAEHLARLSDSCHQASLAPVVADPAILPSLIARESAADWEATIALIDAREVDDVIVTDETLTFSAVTLSEVRTSPDVLRLIQSHFMDAALRASVEHDPHVTTSAETFRAIPNREVPESFGGDPLVDLLSRSVDAGEACTHIWTSPHLWHAEENVRHLLINNIRHPLITEYNNRVEEMA